MEYKVETKNCQNCKKDFVIEPEDFNFYKKIKVPPPTWCPECRMIRRMMFRDNRVFYKRKSDKTGKIIFSIFHPESPFKVWERDIWWSDEMNGLDYGVDVDFNKIFLEQLKDLFYKVPLPSQTVWNLINSDYCTGSSNLKNCYLVFVSNYSEDCMYSSEIANTKNSIDVTRIESSELCYQSFALLKCYKTFFSSHCESCMDVWFSRDLIGCDSCFGCTNLRNKRFCIFNKQYTKEEYDIKIKNFNLNSYKSLLKIKENTKILIKDSIRKFIEGHTNINISGEYINNSRNVQKSYYVNQVENSKYIQLFFSPSSKDCYDCTLWGENVELIYECSSIGSDCYDVKFCARSYKGAQNCEYSLYCVGCSNIFGCSGLKNKQYCILNKQYTKEQYEKIISKIKEHMKENPFIDRFGRIYKYGEYFPVEFSPFAYNETTAQEYFPLTKEEAIKNGFKWRDRENRNYISEINPIDIPDEAKDINEKIINKVIGCLHYDLNSHQKLDCKNICTEAFRITESEFSFYKRMNLPLPRICPNCRYQERLEMRNPIKLFYRKCMKEGCQNTFETSYAPDRPEIVYCEECYKREVY